MHKRSILITFSVLTFLAGIASLFILLESRNINQGLQLAEKHTIVAPLFLIIWRTVGIIFPFFPAGIVSFALVPIFGWFYTYTYTLLGIIIGTSIAFCLARIFREHLVERFLSLKKIHKMENDMSKKKEFMAIVALRLFTVPVMDFSSYIAGLTKISYKKFTLATIIASTSNLITFYIGDEAYKRIFGKSIFIVIIALIIFSSSYYMIKRYKIIRQNKLFRFSLGYSRKIYTYVLVYVVRRIKVKL